MKVSTYKHISIYSGESIRELTDNVSKAIKEIEKENPDWATDSNHWDIDEEGITLYYMREETPEEKARRERYFSDSIQRDKDTLKRLMEKYPEEVQKNLK